MRKIFIVACRAQESEFLNADKEELFFSPLYEHTYKKFIDAVGFLKIDCEIVRSASYTLEGVSSELNCDLEDIVIFAHPLAFLAERALVEDAIRFVAENDLAYATVGEGEIYATIGTGKLLSEETVASPSDFLQMIQNCGATCQIGSFGTESAMPKSRSEYLYRVDRYRREFLDYLCERNVKIDVRDGVLISAGAVIGEGTTILPNTQICGHSVIGKGCLIGPNAIVSGSIVCDGGVVDSSYVYASTIEKDVEIGPFCHISNSCHILSGARVLAYTKLQSSVIGINSVIHEHCVIVDTETGLRVTIGAGVNTVNYDGKKVSECKIGNDAFIGAGSNLIAPLNVGAGSYVAAGSTITDDVGSGALAIARQYQTNHDGWARRRKR